jgi:hypothetical protein
MEMEAPHFRNFFIGFHTGAPLANELHQEVIVGALKDPLNAIGRKCESGDPWAAWCFLPGQFRDWTRETFFLLAGLEQTPG